MIKVQLACAIIETLESAGVSQATLAGAAGVSPATVNHVVTGRLEVVTVDIMLHLCEVLGIEIMLNIKKPA